MVYGDCLFSLLHIWAVALCNVLLAESGVVDSSSWKNCIPTGGQGVTLPVLGGAKKSQQCRKYRLQYRTFALM